MKVMSLTLPSLIQVLSSDVFTSSYPPLGARYWIASRTPNMARTIHSQGPLNMRFTCIFRLGSRSVSVEQVVRVQAFFQAG